MTVFDIGQLLHILQGAAIAVIVLMLGIGALLYICDRGRAW